MSAISAPSSASMSESRLQYIVILKFFIIYFMNRDQISARCSSEQYSSPMLSMLMIEVEHVLCQSMIFGNNGGAGSDIGEDDIIDGGEF